MQSKTSCFNITLFRKNLSRFWPLWGLAGLVAALFPLAELVNLLQYGRPYPTIPEFSRMYYEVVAALPVLALVYAALCALAVWSYLFSARSIGLLHTLPIRREGLFVTNFLSGMAMMLIPCAAAGIVSILTSLVCGAFDAASLAVTILAVLGEVFFYFSSATFVCFITGNAFAMPPLYALLHFLAVLLDQLISSFAQGFIFGLSSSYTGVVEWLSPTVYLNNHVRAVGQYMDVERFLPEYGGPYIDSVLTSVELENVRVVGLYALAGAVLAVLSLLLCRRRRSETAGDVVAVGALRPVFRYGVAGLAALLGGQFLYSLFCAAFQTGAYYMPIPLAACMLAAGAVGYFGASMLLSKSLRVFRSSWKGLIAVAAGCAGLCCVLHFDLLGVAGRVPAASEVDEVYVRMADNSYTFLPGEDAELLEQARSIHQAIIDDEQHILDLDAQQATSYSDRLEPATAYDMVRFTYYLKNGRTVLRSYYVPLTRDRVAQAGTYDYLLDQFVNSEALKAQRLHLNDDFWTVEGGALALYARDEYYDLNSREASAVLEAVGRDLYAGAWGNYDWFAVNDGSDYAMDLELSFAGPDGEGNDYITIILNPAMTETTACLRELGLITEEDLVTRRQLYPEDYAQDSYGDAVYYTSGAGTVEVSGACGTAEVSPA